MGVPWFRTTVEKDQASRLGARSAEVTTCHEAEGRLPLIVVLSAGSCLDSQ